MFTKLWKSKAPHKARVLAWIILLNKLPTNDNLQKRVILLPNDSRHCVLCNQEEEFVIHLFFTCNVVYGLWQKCM